VATKSASYTGNFLYHPTRPVGFTCDKMGHSSRSSPLTRHGPKHALSIQSPRTTLRVIILHAKSTETVKCLVLLARVSPKPPFMQSTVQVSSSQRQDLKHTYVVLFCFSRLHLQNTPVCKLVAVLQPPFMTHPWKCSCVSCVAFDLRASCSVSSSPVPLTGYQLTIPASTQTALS
jgi:hypothetical protein